MKEYNIPVLEIKNFEKESIVMQSGVHIASKEELALYKSASSISLADSAYIMQWQD